MCLNLERMTMAKILILKIILQGKWKRVLQELLQFKSSMVKVSICLNWMQNYQ